MKTFTVGVCALMVVLAANVQAVTIFEDFSGSLSNWSTTGTAITATQPIAQFDDKQFRGGFMDVTWSYYGTAAQSRFTRPLGTTVTQNDSIWMQMDILHDTSDSTNSWTQNGYFAGMKSGDTKNEINLIGDRLFFAFSTSADIVGSTRGNRHDIYVYGSDGLSQAATAVYPGSAPNSYTYLDDYITGYRVKFHYDAATKNASQDAYEISSNGSTGDLIWSNTTAYGSLSLLNVTKNFSLDSFGLANSTNGTKQFPTQGMLVDNLYFSTDNALSAGDESGGWEWILIPEPVTIALLGLGALVLRRRK